MLAAIVLTANHYLFDGLVGGVIALLIFVASRLGSAGRWRGRAEGLPGPVRWALLRRRGAR